MASVRFLLLGTGFFARKWLETLKAHPDCALAGVISRTPERAAATCAELGLPAPAFATLEQARARVTADAALVTLPQALHREAIAGALACGLHVLTEKPLAMDMAEAAAILEAARARADRCVMVNQNFRWRPTAQALRRALLDGAIGPPQTILHECAMDNRRVTVGGWREALPDPYLQDMAIHHFDLLRYLTGREAVEVFVRAFRPSWTWFAGRPAAAGFLQFGDVAVSYSGTFAARGRETLPEGAIALTGEGGTLRLDERGEVSLHRDGRLTALPRPALAREDLAATLDQFVIALRSGARPETSLEDNLKSFAIVCAALESSQSGRPVAVSPLLASLSL
ncbi:MAG: Gfo/Idh/MocA family oxidoreductase [candidate division NC10 bacterium]|nr:Gfo/Idh/MocA family oxidoreductase [candidate division NC10 bacterium]